MSRTFGSVVVFSVLFACSGRSEAEEPVMEDQAGFGLDEEAPPLMEDQDPIGALGPIPNQCLPSETVRFGCVLEQPRRIDDNMMDGLSPDNPFSSCAGGKCVVSVCSKKTIAQGWDDIIFRMDKNVAEVDAVHRFNPFSATSSDALKWTVASQGTGYAWSLETRGDAVFVRGSNTSSAFMGTFEARCADNPQLSHALNALRVLSTLPPMTWQ